MESLIALDALLARQVMGWTEAGRGWRTASGDRVAYFRPTIRRGDALRLSARLRDLGFSLSLPARRASDEEGEYRVVFGRGDESWSVLAESEPLAISLAARLALAQLTVSA